MIRDEMDILPAWLAGVARWADIAVLIDHGSTDGTSELLQAVCEDAPHDWQVVREDDPAYRQEMFTEWAVSAAFAQGADWVLPLDADELLNVADRADLEARLATVPAGLVGALQWVNQIAARKPGMWWVTPWRCGTRKVAIPRGVWRPGCSLPLGNHCLHSAAFPGMQVPMSYVADLLHYPLRSVAQMRRKLRQGSDALRLRADAGGGFQQWTWGEATLGRGDETLLRAWAMTYPQPPQAPWASVDEADFERWGWPCVAGPNCEQKSLKDFCFASELAV